MLLWLKECEKEKWSSVMMIGNPEIGFGKSYDGMVVILCLLGHFDDEQCSSYTNLKASLIMR